MCRAFIILKDAIMLTENFMKKNLIMFINFNILYCNIKKFAIIIINFIIVKVVVMNN